MESHAQEILTAAGADPATIAMRHTADMRYVGQGFEVNVPLTREDIESRDHRRLEEVFNANYERIFHRRLNHVPVEAITWRFTASEPPPRPEMRFGSPPTSQYPNGLKRRRPIFIHEEGGYADVPVYDRYSLQPGTSFAGPAVVEERESTVVVGPDAQVSVDSYLNLVMELG
jgi:N-methylhydantoinase A